MDMKPVFPPEFGRLGAMPRQRLFTGSTPLEPMPNLSAHCDGATLFVKRDDCTNLAFGGNKVRQLEFYFGDACANNADTILITGAVQSNFVRLAAAGARKLGMTCHVQLEERVVTEDSSYRTSGNVLIDRLLGATLHPYPHGEDESGADQQLEEIALELKSAGHRPYVIHLAPGHSPLGSLGYVVAAQELLIQLNENELEVNEIFVGSGSGATHAGILFGLRALGSAIAVNATPHWGPARARKNIAPAARVRPSRHLRRRCAPAGINRSIVEGRPHAERTAWRRRRDHARNGRQSTPAAAIHNRTRGSLKSSITGSSPRPHGRGED